jgi:hypothetical protein
MARKLLVVNGAAGSTGAAFSSFGKYGTVFSVTGDFYGATATIELTPDGGTTWGTLKDANGVDIEITSENTNVFAEIIPAEYNVRGVITGGDSGGTTSLNIMMFD